MQSHSTLLNLVFSHKLLLRQRQVKSTASFQSKIDFIFFFFNSLMLLSCLSNKAAQISRALDSIHDLFFPPAAVPLKF